MPDELTIRDIRPEDIPAIREITKAAWAAYFQYTRTALGEPIDSVVHGDASQWKPEQVARQCLGQRSEHVLVAEADGEVAGFVVYYLDVGRGGVGEISNNAVSPDFQGRGIATKLYREVLRRMRQAGMKVAKVLTGMDESHAPARHTYEKVGFSRSIQSVEYYQML